jgi:hypothetical protein
MSQITGIPKFWGYKDLVAYYRNTEMDTRRKRLLEILDWAKDNDAFICSKNVFPSFGIRGRNGRRLISVWSPDKSHPSMPPGTVYIFINPVTKFDNDVNERDKFVDRLRQLKPLGFGDISKNVAGINSKGTIDKLNQAEFTEFMAVIKDFCFNKGCHNYYS